MQNDANTASVDPASGCLMINLDGATYFAHDLAWMYVHGEMPKAPLVHVNGDVLDNRIANLREMH